MFEAYIVGLLQEYLGSFVKAKSLQKERLRADVYNGHVCLENLELNPSCLNFLNLPLSLIKGYIGQIELKISGGNWTNLVSSARIEVVVDHVYLLVGPKFNWSEKEKKDREEYAKESKLRRAELFAVNQHNAESGNQSEKSGNDSFISRLGTRLVDNIELLVKNVHIRYEDHISRPERPFAFGFTLESFRMNSTDGDWEDTYVDRSARTVAAIHKRIRLKQFSIYCNPVSEDRMFKGVDVMQCTYEEWARVFAPPSLGTPSNTKRTHHILRPLDAQVFLRIADDTFDTTGDAHTTAEIQIHNVAVTIEEFQYHNLLFLISGFEGYTKRERYSHLRPRVRVMESPGRWWKYAYHAICMDSRERAKAYLPESVAKRRRVRLEYMTLWKRKCVGSSMVTPEDEASSKDSDQEDPGNFSDRGSTSEKNLCKIFSILSAAGVKRIKEIEKALNVEDILFFRSLADSELERTRVERERIYRKLHEESEGNGGGVLGYFFGGTGSSNRASTSEPDSVPILSATERAKVFNDLGYDPSRGIAQYDFPRDFVFQRLKFRINFLTFEVVSTESFYDETEAVSSGGIHMNNESVLLSTANRPASKGASSSASSNSAVEDASFDLLNNNAGNNSDSEMQTERVLHATITGLQIEVHQRVESQRIEVQLESIKAVDPQVHSSRMEHRLIQRRLSGREDSAFGTSEQESLLLSLSLDQNPPHIEVDSQVILEMEPLEIVYNANCFARVSSCFSVPASMDTWEQLEIAAMSRLNSLEAGAAAKFEYAMSNHVKFDVNVNIAAPIIILPENIFFNHSIDPAQPWGKSAHGDYNRNILLCDLGRFQFQSQSKGKDKRSRDSHEDARRHEYGKDVDARSGDRDHVDNEEFYDHYQVRMSDLQVLLLRDNHTMHEKRFRNIQSQNRQPKDTISHQDYSLLRFYEINNAVQLIEKFVCTINLQVSILPFDRTISRLKIWSLIPSLRFQITTKSYQSVLSLIKSYEEEEEEEDDDEQQAFDRYSSSDMTNEVNIRNDSSAVANQLFHGTSRPGGSGILLRARRMSQNLQMKNKRSLKSGKGRPFRNKKKGVKGKGRGSRKTRVGNASNDINWRLLEASFLIMDAQLTISSSVPLLNEHNYYRHKRRPKHASVHRNNTSSDKGSDILRLQLNNFSTNTVVRTMSTELRLSLHGIEIEDLLRAKTAINETRYLLKPIINSSEKGSSKKLVTVTLISQIEPLEDLSTGKNPSNDAKSSGYSRGKKHKKGKRNKRKNVKHEHVKTEAASASTKGLTSTAASVSLVLDTFSVRCQQRTMAALFSIFMSVGNSSSSSPNNKIPTMIKKKLRKRLGSLRKKKSRRSIFMSPSLEGRSSSSKSALNISNRRSNYSSGVESSPGNTSSASAFNYGNYSSSTDEDILSFRRRQRRMLRADESYHTPPDNAKGSSQLNVSLIVKGVELYFDENNRCLGCITLGESALEIDSRQIQANRTLFVKGTIGYVSLLDLTRAHGVSNASTAMSQSVEVFGLHDDNETALATFDMSQDSKMGMDVVVKMTSVKLVVLSLFLGDLYNYIADGALARSLVSRTPQMKKMTSKQKNYFATVKKPPIDPQSSNHNRPDSNIVVGNSRIKFDIQLESPVLILPRGASSPEMFVVSLGNISIKNTYREKDMVLKKGVDTVIRVEEQVVFLKFNDTNVRCGTEQILDDHSASVELVFDKYDNLSVHVQVSKLHFGFSQEHVSLMTRIWFENLRLGASASRSSADESDIGDKNGIGGLAKISENAVASSPIITIRSANNDNPGSPLSTHTPPRQISKAKRVTSLAALPVLELDESPANSALESPDSLTYQITQQQTFDFIFDSVELELLDSTKKNNRGVNFNSLYSNSNRTHNSGGAIDDDTVNGSSIVLLKLSNIHANLTNSNGAEETYTRTTCCINSITMVDSKSSAGHNDDKSKASLRRFRHLIAPRDSSDNGTVDIEYYIDKVTNEKKLVVDIPFSYRFALIPSSIYSVLSYVETSIADTISTFNETQFGSSTNVSSNNTTSARVYDDYGHMDTRRANVAEARKRKKNGSEVGIVDEISTSGNLDDNGYLDPNTPGMDNDEDSRKRLTMTPQNSVEEPIAPAATHKATFKIDLKVFTPEIWLFEDAEIDRTSVVAFTCVLTSKANLGAVNDTLNDFALDKLHVSAKEIKSLTYIVHNRVGEESYNITKPLYFVHPFDIILDVGGNGNIDEIEIPQSLLDPSPPPYAVTGKTDDEDVDFTSTDARPLSISVNISAIDAKIGYHDIQLFNFVLKSWDRNATRGFTQYGSNGTYFNDDRRTTSNSDAFSDSDFDTSSKTSTLLTRGNHDSVAFRGAGSEYGSSNYDERSTYGGADSVSRPPSMIGFNDGDANVVRHQETSKPFEWPLGALAIDLAEFKVSLTNDLLSQNVPVADFKLNKIGFHLVSSETQIQTNLGFEIGVEYNNFKLMTWEPFIEPWRVELGCSIPKDILDASPHSRESKNYNTNKQDEKNNGNINTTLEYKVEATLNAFQPCNINVTEALLENVRGIGDGINWLNAANNRKEQNAMTTKHSRSEFSFYKVINQTGMPLLYWTEDGSRHLLQPHCHAPLHFANQPKDTEDQGEQNIGSRTIMINMLDLTEAGEYLKSKASNRRYSSPNLRSQNATKFLPQRIRVDVSGARVYDLMLSTDLKNGKVESDTELKTVRAANLKFNDHPKPVSSLSVNVTSRDGSKCIYLQSGMILKNYTNRSYFIQCSDKRSGTDSHRRDVGVMSASRIDIHNWSNVLKPGHTCSVPIYVNLDATDLLLTPLPSDVSDSTSMPNRVNTYTSSRMPIKSTVARAHGNGSVLSWPVDFRKGSLGRSLSVEEADTKRANNDHWKNDELDNVQMYLCLKLDDAADKALGIVQLDRRKSVQKSQKRYMRLLSLHPSVQLQNCIPDEIEFQFLLNKLRMEGLLNSGENVSWEGILESKGEMFDGSKTHSLSVDENDVATSKRKPRKAQSLICRVCLPECDWSDSIEILQYHRDRQKHKNGATITQSIRCIDRKNRNFYVQAEIKTLIEGTLHILIYVPYWINNLTGLPLIFQHRSSMRNGEIVACQSDDRSDDTIGDMGGDEAESQALFLGTGPRKLGLRELLPGKNGELVPGLVDARRVGMMETRVGKIPQRRNHENHLGPGDKLILMDFSDTNKMSSRVAVRLARGMNSTHATSTFTALLPTEWSQPFALDSAGTTGEVEIPEENTFRGMFGSNDIAAYSLGVSIGLGRGPFLNTKIITVTPRFILVNCTGRPLLVKQENAKATRYVASGSSDRALLVMPDARCAFHWADSRAIERRMTVRFDEYGWQFCSGFDVTHVGTFSLNLRNTHNNKQYIARVNIEQQGPTLVIQFDAELPTMPPYIIENKSHRTIRFWQKNVEKAAIVVLPYKGAKYTWDDLSQERILVVECQPKDGGSDNRNNNNGIVLGAFSVDKIDEYKDLPVDKINVVVFPAGPTKVLRVIDKRIEDHNRTKDERNKSRMRYNGRFIHSKRRTDHRTQLGKNRPFRSRRRNSSTRRNSRDSIGYHKSRYYHDAESDGGETGLPSSRTMFKNRYSPPRKRYFSANNNNNRALQVPVENKLSSILTQSVIKTYAYSFTINLRGFGISVIDNLPRELLFCSIEDVFVSTNYDKSHNRISASIGDLQIDNQLHSTNFPVFLFTGRKNLVSTARKGRLSGVSVDNTITGSPPRANTLVGNALSCNLVSKRTTEITFIENFSIGITPLDLNIDGDVLVGLWEMITRIKKYDLQEPANILLDANDSEEDNIINTVGANGQYSGEDTRSNSQDTAFRDTKLARGDNNKGRVKESKGILKSLTQNAYSSQESYSIKRGSKTPNVRTYFQFFKVDQLDLHISFNSGTVGAASSMLRSMGATLTRIENAPLRLHGVTLRHAYESFSTIAETITAQYSFDALRQAYVILGSSELLGNPISLFKHLGTGVRDFFYEPAVGLIQSPSIFLRGIQRGTLSLVQNTFVGVSTFVGTICLSILRAITPFAPSIFGFDRFLHGVEGAAVALGGTLGALEKEKLRMRRVRPPRVFADPSLKVYNREIEEGDEILSRVSNGKYWGENCTQHFYLQKGLILVITCQRVLIVTEYYEKHWEMMLSDIYRVYRSGDDTRQTEMSDLKSAEPLKGTDKSNVVSFDVLPTDVTLGFKIEKVDIYCRHENLEEVELKLQEALASN